MPVEIRKVREAQRLIDANLTWITRQLSDPRIQEFKNWASNLDFGAPLKLKADVATFQDEMQACFNAMTTTFDTLYAIRDRLQQERDGVDETIQVARIEVSEEVRRYLPKEEEPIKPEEPIKEEGGIERAN